MKHLSIRSLALLACLGAAHAAHAEAVGDDVAAEHPGAAGGVPVIIKRIVIGRKP